MTETTPLARKLWDAHNDAGGSHVKAWNNVAKVAYCSDYMSTDTHRGL